MNILLLTTHLNFGGIASYTVSLAKALKARGHKVKIASSGGDFLGALQDATVEHIMINIHTKSELSPRLIFSFNRLLKLIKEDKIELLHAQTRVTGVLSCWLSKSAHIPYVSTCHGFFKPHLGRRLFPCWGDKVIAISEAVREHLVNDMKVGRENVRLIHNGVDLKKFRVYSLKFREDLRREFGLKEGPVIGIIARLSPVKGHRFLIVAMKEILLNEPNVQLLIVGDGECKEKLRKLANNLGIANCVYFVPPILDTPKPLSVMDIFVMPSLQEGLGLSIMEAQAASLPIVASNVGGIYTLVRDGQTGFLVPPRSPEALSKAILSLLKDKECLKRMGENGHRLIEERFSLEEMAGKIEEVYLEVTRK
jgi:glycosyltransferase involved in cell wall biosynthesis